MVVRCRGNCVSRRAFGRTASTTTTPQFCADFGRDLPGLPKRLRSIPFAHAPRGSAFGMRSISDRMAANGAEYESRSSQRCRRRLRVLHDVTHALALADLYRQI